MPVINGKTYSSKKHPVLEFIFEKYFDPSKRQEVIPFYLIDISEGYRHHRIQEPASISNTILDLCRVDRGIDSRVPKSISALGYDLRKKTGVAGNGKKFAGEFVLMGAGVPIQSWLVWDESPEKITISSKELPDLTRKLVRPDEGGLFSVIDYLDVFTKVLGRPVYRIQNPMKWQPNEIDGFYASTNGGDTYIYPVEAKALTTGDAINLDQIAGGFRTVLDKMEALSFKVHIQQIAVRMIKNGIDIAIFSENLAPVEPERYVRVTFDPAIENWK